MLAFAPLSGAALGADAQVPVEPYFKRADFGELRISPSGKYIAGLIPAKGRLRLAILDLTDHSARPIASIEDVDISWVAWINDDRLVFTTFDYESGLGMQSYGGIFAVNRDGTDFRELAPIARAEWGRRGTRFLSTLNDGSKDILVIANDTSFQSFDVYRMDTMTGRKTVKSFGKPGEVYAWVPDWSGALRGAIAEEKGIVRSYFRSSESSPWVLIGEYPQSGPRIVPVAFDGDGTLIVASDVGRDTFALYRYDTAKNALGELVAAHPQADLLGGLIEDRTKKRIVGVRYEGERAGAAYFDEDWARMQKAVDDALPGHVNVVTRGEAPRALVYSYSDTDPGSYWLLDLTARKLEPLAVRRKSIKPEEMPSREPVRYAARDGLEIPGYLTLPKGKAPKDLPLVLYVHGGPNLRGTHWAWNAEAAYLAALGYAVLEPDFRGSRGWGRKLFESGWKQWGRAMQDDLNDGVDWLAAKGTIDPSRVCIMGASYGGYAVMMGLARDPTRWRCGVNYVGVTDINMMFDVSWSDMFDSEYMRYAAKELMGDPDKDAEMLKAASPLENAAKIKAPVLMAYGGLDVRVPLVHGEKMRDALNRNGASVEWVVYSDEGHGFLREANRYDFYRRVARFLERNLAPR
jgi:dipeptidyl aminopeptidase/acylaminoacyl peptidase